MFSEKNFVVTIGNYGAVVALYEKNEIKNKIFLEELTDELKADLKKLFVQNQSAPIYVLLDTIDQSYRKKTYPYLRKHDLHRIIKRDLANDGNKDSIKNYLILNNANKKSGKAAVPVTNRKWDCLFVSSSNSEVINKWMGFLIEMPNRLVGIYMLPIEALSTFDLLKNSIKKSAKIPDKKSDLYCIVIQNKVSGIRQIVFSSQGIVFTRVVNYNFQDVDFVEKYTQDIHSTFEYLKRLFPDLTIEELDVVNIFPEEVLATLRKIDSSNLSIINYTPFQAAVEIGYSKLLPENSNYCDLLISKVFSKSNKILRFSNQKIDFFEKFFLILKSSYYLNLSLVALIGLLGIFIVFSATRVDLLVSEAEKEKAAALEEMERIKTQALDIDAKESTVSTANGEIDIDRVLDLGKINEALGKDEVNLLDLYSNLAFLVDFNAKISSFSYFSMNFDSKNPNSSSKYKINFIGEIVNKSGDIDDLFKEFDSVIAESKKAFGSQYIIKYSELPQNINFTEKYYSFPIEFTITKNQ